MGKQKLPTGPKAHSSGGVFKASRTNPRNNFAKLERAIEQANPLATRFVKSKRQRCQQFPDCPNRECEYAHPTKPCFAYPNCPQPPGACTYLHPDLDADLIERLEKNKKERFERKRNLLMVQQGLCKFGSHCTKDTCPFAHPTPANPMAKLDTLDWCSSGKVCADAQCSRAHPPPPTAKPVAPTLDPAQLALEQCKFGSQCTNYKCPRRHATSHVPCRLGKDCARPDCFFAHPIDEECRFGEKCTSKFCMYRHPPTREVHDNTWVNAQGAAHPGTSHAATNQRAFAVPDDQVMEQAVQQ